MIQAFAKGSKLNFDDSEEIVIMGDKTYFDALFKLFDKTPHDEIGNLLIIVIIRKILKNTMYYFLIFIRKVFYFLIIFLLFNYFSIFQLFSCF